MSVLTYLEDLEKRLRLSLDEKFAINISISTLKTRLHNYFEDEVIDIRVFGSYKRNTNLCRKADPDSDVDIMVVFRDSEYKPQTYINKLKRFMECKYSSSEIYQSYPCAILELNHIRFELTPALLIYGGMYEIPNSENSYTDWISTTPFYLDELASQKKHDRYTHVTRLVKYWNCLNDKYFASFELEQLVLNTGLYCYADNLQESVFQVIKSIPSYAGPQYVQDYIKKTKDIISYIEQYNESYPISCENKIKSLFKELD